MEETRQFFAALFGSAPEELWASLWTLADKRSHWYQIGDGVEAMAEAAAKLSKRSDVYVSVALVREPMAANRRVSSDLVAGLSGLWADVDIADPDVHKKWNLPPSEEGAMQLVADTGLEPTLLVHSGHGLQVWWLFDQFWLFEEDTDRLEAATLAQSWNATLRIKAAQRDWTVDSTFDLARVMRVPGTVNMKSEPHMPVRLLSVSTQLYLRNEFEDLCLDERALRDMGVTPTREYVVGDLRLDPGANPPFDKFQALLEAEPTFRASWDRRRRDFQDQSPSSYDLSLAAYTVMAGWSDQEIVDLIVSSRRKHADDLKLRYDYYSRTLAKAHEGVQREQAIEMMDEVADDLRSAKRTGDEEDVREKKRAVLESISQQIGIEVIRVVKYRSTPPSYRLETPTGGVDLGGSADVISWTILRAKVAAETNILIGRFKAAAWDRLVQMIFEVCEEQDTGLESTEVGQVYLWLSEYLIARPPVEDRQQAFITEYPYRDDDGSVMVFGSSFRRWLWLNRGERPTQRELGRMLRMYGCMPHRLNVSVDGANNTRSVWRVPPGRSAFAKEEDHGHG